MDGMAAASHKNITAVEVRAAVNNAYEEVRNASGGTNASYIPYLAQVDPNLFGVTVCLLDGTLISVGDSAHTFGIESVSKVPTAILAMREYGAVDILEKVGADATGLPFNSIMALLLEKDRPSSPLVNAGAIAACSLVEPVGDADAKWKAITSNIRELTGTEPEVIQELYQSESGCDYNNRSIAWLLKSYGRIYDDPDLSLDLYTRQCSLGTTTEQLAIMGATIANDGFNPVTNTQVFDPDLAPKVTSMITTVGFYERTGDWLYRSGIPAKSGVGGGVLGVMPGMFGIAAFSPPLDEAGNSVKAQLAIRHIMHELGLNIFAASRLCVCQCTPTRER